MTKQFISYNQIHESIRLAVDKHDINNDFKPDVMIAIGGGGFIPARILRTFLHKRNNRNIPIQAVGLSLYEEIEIAQQNNEDSAPQVRKTQWLNFGSHTEISLVDRNILIVDEVDDTRQTLGYAVDELLKDIEAEEIRMGKKKGTSKTKLGIFVLHNKDKDKKRTLPESVMKHYFAAVEMPDEWLVYPWDAQDIGEHTKNAKDAHDVQNVALSSAKSTSSN